VPLRPGRQTLRPELVQLELFVPASTHPIGERYALLSLKSATVRGALRPSSKTSIDLRQTSH